MPELEHAARDEILKSGGSLSHHHGVGKIRRDFLRACFRRPAWSGRDVKRAVDPTTRSASRINDARRRRTGERSCSLVSRFLVRCLLEELVRRRDELCIDRIGVVIRPLRGLSAEERFRREVARSHVFAKLPECWTGLVTA